MKITKDFIYIMIIVILLVTTIIIAKDNFSKGYGACVDDFYNIIVEKQEPSKVLCERHGDERCLDLFQNENR